MHLRRILYQDEAREGQEGDSRYTGWLKNKKVIMCHANDRRGLTDLKLVIRAVGVGEQVFVLNPDPLYSTQIVVGNELSIKCRYVAAIS